MKCPRCRSVNPDDTTFCGTCAAPLAPGPASMTRTLERASPGLAGGSLVAGKYRILGPLGRGGMGVVYKAEDTQLRRTVALKFLSPDLAAQPLHRKRFTQEARNASALNHPNICTIYEVGEAGEEPYIAMEYLEGRPLEDLVPPDGLPAGELVRYATQIAEGVRHAHERNIVHRDLKSSNVVITAEGRAKVLDFGLAKRLEDVELSQVTRSQVSLTQEGLVAGTLPYLAPELLHGAPADARSDIWAFGVILYQMASGRLPFEGRTGFALTTSILRDRPAPLPPALPAGLAALIEKCLEKVPSKRYQTLSEVCTALEAPALLAFPRRSKGPARARLKWGRWALAAAGLCLAGVLISGLFSKKGPEKSFDKTLPAVSTGGRASPNPEANEYFEKGVFFLKAQFDLPKARAMLEKALVFDPAFAEARAWYGFTFVLEIDSGFSNDTNYLYRAEQELRRALSDDPMSSRAHSGLAASYFYQGRKELAFEEAKTALEIDPDDVDAANWLANYHKMNGDFAEAKRLLYGLLERDPLFFPVRMNLGDLLRVEGDLAGAVREQMKILEQDSRNIYATQKLAQALIDKNDLAGARRALEDLPPGDQQGYDVRITWALLLALEGKTEEAMKEMDDECQKYGALAIWSTSVVAEFYAIVGQPEKALDWLERAVRNGDERDAWFRRDPLLAKIRDLPRFRQILESIASRRKSRTGSK